MAMIMSDALRIRNLIQVSLTLEIVLEPEISKNFTQSQDQNVTNILSTVGAGPTSSVVPNVNLVERISYSTVLVVLGLTIVGGNGLFIVAYYASKMRTFCKTANYMYFYIHLAFADLIVGFSIPFHIALYVRPRLLESPPFCVARYATICFPMAASVMSLLIITIDRYIAFKYPLRYHVLVTHRRSHVVMLVAWILSLLLGLIGPILSVQKGKETTPGGAPYCDFARFMSTWYLRYLIIPPLLVVTVTISVLYGFILKIVHYHSARRRKMSSTIRDRARSSTKPRMSRFKQEIQVAKIGALVLGIFYICWLPFLIILSIQVYSGQQENPTLRRMRTWATFPAITNSAVNCFVYAIRMPKFRAMVKELFRLKAVRKPPRSHAMTVSGEPNNSSTKTTETYDETVSTDVTRRNTDYASGQGSNPVSVT